MLKLCCFASLTLGLLAVGLASPAVSAEDITLAEGKLVLKAPESWKKKTPKVRIIEHEFEIPPVEGDETAGRMTVMGAGGSVEDNVSRWIGQFEGATKEKTKRQEAKVAGQKVYLVDISGTYKDSPGGPFAGAKPILREDYRMLGAIITTEKNGNYFLKFYGPKATVEKNEEAFTKMVDSLKVK